MHHSIYLDDVVGVLLSLSLSLSLCLCRTQARQRILLTGTPLQNDLGELMSLLSFVAPTLLGEGAPSLLAAFRSSGRGNGSGAGAGTGTGGPSASHADDDNNDDDGDGDEGEREKEGEGRQGKGQAEGAAPPVPVTEDAVLASERVARARRIMAPFVLRRTKDQVRPLFPSRRSWPSPAHRTSPP
jgi:hypothetical protein